MEEEMGRAEIIINEIESGGFDEDELDEIMKALVKEINKEK